MRKATYILKVLFAFACLFSCNDENNIKNLEIEEEPVSVSISLNLDKVKTKAINSSNESVISKLTLLVLDEADRFLYSRIGEFKEEKEDKKIYQFKVLTTNNSRRFVLVANAEIQDIPLHTNIEDIFNYTYYTTSDNDESIPMWGIKEVPKIDYITVNPVVVELIRSMARFDVYVNVDNPLSDSPQQLVSLSRFELVGCQIYRQMFSGYAMPHFLPLPCVPIMSGRGDINNPTPQLVQLYDEERFGIVGKMYTNESEAGDRTNATTIILSARFDNQETYYRINVGKFDNLKRFQFDPIIRNTKYIFNITSVRSKGYDTVQEALDGEPSNIDYMIVEWGNELNGNVVFDGLHYFYIEQRDLIFSRNSGVSRLVRVLSDVPVKEWEMSFSDPTNGYVPATKESVIANNRFKIEKSERTLTFTTLKSFKDLSEGESHYDIFVLKAAGLTIYINLEQRDYDTDWGNGGIIEVR